MVSTTLSYEPGLSVVPLVSVYVDSVTILTQGTGDLVPMFTVGANSASVTGPDTVLRQPPTCPSTRFFSRRWSRAAPTPSVRQAGMRTALELKRQCTKHTWQPFFPWYAGLFVGCEQSGSWHQSRFRVVWWHCQVDCPQRQLCRICPRPLQRWQPWHDACSRSDEQGLWLHHGIDP